MSEREREYNRNYHKNIRRPKTVASKVMAAAICQICGDQWADTYAGYNSEIFICLTCDTQLSKWDREKEKARREMEPACQVCHVLPAISLHEASQLRCCFVCSDWLSEREAEGSRPWEAKGDPWDADAGGMLVGHIFPSSGDRFDLYAVASLCGAKAPVWPIAMDMTMPAAVRRFGLCVACLQACPDPVGISRRHNYFAYVVPTFQEIAPAVGTS